MGIGRATFPPEDKVLRARRSLCGAHGAGWQKAPRRIRAESVFNPFHHVITPTDEESNFLYPPLAGGHSV